MGGQEVKWRIKVRKLLALAQSDNPHEAERAREQAQKLMSKHGLTEESAEMVAGALNDLGRIDGAGANLHVAASNARSRELKLEGGKG